jgi:hypothetical protein
MPRLQTTGTRGVTSGMAATSLEERGTTTTTTTTGASARGVETLGAETRGPGVESYGGAGVAPAAGYTTTTAAGTTGVGRVWVVGRASLDEGLGLPECLRRHAGRRDAGRVCLKLERQAVPLACKAAIVSKKLASF